MKDKIKKWYKMGLWTQQQVEEAHRKGIIDLNQLNEILNVKS